VFLSIVSPLFTVSGPCGDRVINTFFRRRGQDNRKDSTTLREPNDTKAAFVGLACHRLVMADLFHLFRYNIVAGDVGHIPSIPDEAANGEHGGIVTHCVTKSRSVLAQFIA
jgi:hypothetical protein